MSLDELKAHIKHRTTDIKPDSGSGEASDCREFAYPSVAGSDREGLIAAVSPRRPAAHLQAKQGADAHGQSYQDTRQDRLERSKTFYIRPSELPETSTSTNQGLLYELIAQRTRSKSTPGEASSAMNRTGSHDESVTHTPHPPPRTERFTSGASGGANAMASPRAARPEMMYQLIAHRTRSKSTPGEKSSTTNAGSHDEPATQIPHPPLKTERLTSGVDGDHPIASPRAAIRRSQTMLGESGVQASTCNGRGAAAPVSTRSLRMRTKEFNRSVSFAELSTSVVLDSNHSSKEMYDGDDEYTSSYRNPWLDAYCQSSPAMPNVSNAVVKLPPL